MAIAPGVRPNRPLALKTNASPTAAAMMAAKAGQLRATQAASAGQTKPPRPAGAAAVQAAQRAAAGNRVPPKGGATVTVPYPGGGGRIMRNGQTIGYSEPGRAPAPTAAAALPPKAPINKAPMTPNRQQPMRSQGGLRGLGGAFRR